MSDNESTLYRLGYIIKNKNKDQQNIPNKGYNIFMRGLFDVNGTISKKNALNTDLVCELILKFIPSDELIDFIKKFYNIEHDFIKSKSIYTFIYYNSNALDFLSKIYDNSDARYRNNEKYNQYINILNNELPICHVFKSIPNAIIPFKEKASDSGYIIHGIEIIKKIGSKTVVLETGIIVEPQFGYYIEIYPLKTLINFGYILSNSIDIIDSGFKNTLKIYLTKIDNDLPDLNLPFKCCQI